MLILKNLLERKGETQTPPRDRDTGCSILGADSNATTLRLASTIFESSFESANTYWRPAPPTNRLASVLHSPQAVQPTMWEAFLTIQQVHCYHMIHGLTASLTRGQQCMAHNWPHHKKRVHVAHVGIHLEHIDLVTRREQPAVPTGCFLL